jgi:hypothetical protein
MPTAARFLIACLFPLALAAPSPAGAELAPTQTGWKNPRLQLQPAAGTVPWYWLNPQPTGADLSDVSFSDDLTATAVGFGGTIIRPNGGVFWTKQNTDTPLMPGGVDEFGRVVGAGSIVSSAVPLPNSPPPVITSFVAVAANDHVDLEWRVEPLADVLGYRIVRSDVVSGDVWFPESGMLEPTAIEYRDTAVETGSSYDYTLVVYVSSGGEVRAVPQSVTIPALPVITRFTAVLDSACVDLQWQVDRLRDVAGFHVLRQCPGEGDVWIPSNALSPSIQSYSDAGVVPDRDYTYTLAAYLTYGGEVRSSPASVSTRLPAITRFDAVPETERVTLSWEIDALVIVEGIHLFRAREGRDDVRIPPTGEFSPSAKSTVDLGLSPGVDYVYTLVMPVKVGDDVCSQPLRVATVALPAITRFDATSVREKIRLDWEMDNEDIVDGYRYRRYCEEEGYVWAPAGTRLPPGTRTVTDGDVVAGRDYFYTLVVYLTMPGEVRSQELAATAEPLPRTYALGQNHPNPFNPATIIPYALPERSRVRLEVFDTGGRRIRVIANQYQEPGYRSLVWDGRNDAGAAVASGVYFYRLSAGGFTSTRKMVLVR